MNSVIERILTILDTPRGLIEIPFQWLIDTLGLDPRPWWYLLYDVAVVIFAVVLLRFFGGKVFAALSMLRRKPPADRGDLDQILKNTQDLSDALLTPEEFNAAIEPLKQGKDWANLGEVYVHLDRSTEAAKAFTKAKDFKKAADQWVRAGKPLKAAKLLSKAGLFDEAGERYMEESRYALAAKAFLKQGSTAYAAYAQEKAGKPQEAFELYNQYFDSNSESGEAQAEAAEKCYTLLQAELAASRTSVQEHTNLMRQVADIFKNEKRHEHAANLYRQAGDVLKAAELYLLAGKLLEASNCYKEGGNPREASRIGGRYYQKIGRWKEAGLAFQSAGEHQSAGECFSRADEPLAAAEAYSEAGNWSKVGLAYAHIGRFEDAVDALQKVTESDGDFDATRALLGRSFYELRDYAHCAATLDNHLTGKRVDSNNIDYFYMLARAQEQLGKLTESRDVLYKIGAVRREFRDVDQRLQTVESRISMLESTGQSPSSPGSPESGAADAQVMKLVAKTLGERYDFERELGRGGMGVVYLARDKQLDRPVALKFLGTSMDHSEEFRQRFVREAQTAAKITHPNIVNIYDISASEGKAYIAMEYIEGADLRAHLEKKGRFSVREAANVMVQACSALAAIHQEGIVHRDVKPENIVIANGGVLKLMDFGLARSEDNRLTSTGISVGTPCYSAPEQILAKNIDARTDLYALGLVFHEMLTGELVFGEGDIFERQVKEVPPKPSSKVEGLRPEIDAFTMKCIEKDPNRRFQSAEELVAALRQAVG